MRRPCALALICASSMLLSGCATPRAITTITLQQLKPHETTKDQVVQMLGEPQQIVKRAPDGETLIYTQKKRSTSIGAAIGALLVSAVIAIPAIVLAPVTGGASLLAIPIYGAAGGVLGGAGGAMVKRDAQMLLIELDEQGLLEEYQLVPLRR